MKSHNPPNSPTTGQIEKLVPVIEPLTYSVAEAAIVLGVSQPSIYRLLARRILHSVPHLRSKRIARGDVKKLVEGGRPRA